MRGFILDNTQEIKNTTNEVLETVDTNSSVSTSADVQGVKTNPSTQDTSTLTDRELIESMAKEIQSLRGELFINRVVFAVCLLISLPHSGQ